MNLKTRLFGPPWESKDAKVRSQAVASEKHPELVKQLDRIAHQDEDAAVRSAALRRLDQPRAWLTAALDDPDPSVRQQAAHSLIRKLCENFEPDTFDTDPRWSQWLQSMTAVDEVRRLARAAVSVKVRQGALRRIGSQGFLGDCLVSEPDDALAGEILQRIDQVSTLKRIAPELKKRRKARHATLINRLAELEQGSEQHTTRDQLALRVVKQMEALARGENIAERGEQVAALERGWNELEAPDAALARRFEGALAIVRRALSAPDRPDPASAEAAPPEQIDAELSQLAEQAKELAASPLDDDTGNRLAELVSKFDRRWNAIGPHDDAHIALRQHFQALIGELQARVQARVQAQAEPPPSPPQAAGNSQAESDLQPLRDEFRDRTEACEKALEGGDIAAAHQALGKARSALDRMPRRGQPSSATGHLQRLAGKLKEMRDWQHWSNNELRERLIERVNEIDVANLHPDAVTERLKELRQRWQELDRLEILPGDKRRFAAPQGQWRRFQQACNKTFDAARPYLEKRTEIRQQSQRDLEDFLDQADKIVQAEQVDTNELLRYQRAAREAIRNLDALPPKSRGRMASKLRELMDALSARLEACFEAVAERKRRLIAEARKLAHEKERATAIDQAKRLQAEWKKAGRTRRKLDEQLWREFREPIDPLFEGMKKEREEQRAANDEHRRELEQLCREAEELAARKGQELVDAGGPMAGLEERFAQASSIPPALRKRFDKTVAAYHARVSEFRHEQRRRGDERLFSLARLLQQRWNELTQGRTPEPTDMDSLPDDERAGNLVRTLQRLASPDQVEAMRAEMADNTARARQVVIEMECLSGLDSPEEDRRQRMDFQVSRLSSRMGEGARRPDLASERAQLQQRWLESFPHDPAAHDALDKRFGKADKILDGMNAT